MDSITVYTTEPCRHCESAKALLRSRGLSFEEINLSKDPAGRTALVNRTGHMTFPQIVIGETVIGGLGELATADEDGTLEKLTS